MITGIRQKAVVGEGGKIEILTDQLPRGTVVEVFVLVESDELDVDTETEQDETDYLLSSPVNRQRLLQAIKALEDRANYTYINPQAL